MDIPPAPTTSKISYLSHNIIPGFNMISTLSAIFVLYSVINLPI
jgi:hypothetical protein